MGGIKVFPQAKSHGTCCQPYPKLPCSSNVPTRGGVECVHGSGREWPFPTAWNLREGYRFSPALVWHESPSFPAATRGHHPVELPASYAGVEARAAARMWLHLRHEAVALQMVDMWAYNIGRYTPDILGAQHTLTPNTGSLMDIACARLSRR